MAWVHYKIVAVASNLLLPIHLFNIVTMLPAVTSATTRGRLNAKWKLSPTHGWLTLMSTVSRLKNFSTFNIWQNPFKLRFHLNFRDLLLASHLWTVFFLNFSQRPQTGLFSRNYATAYFPFSVFVLYNLIPESPLVLSLTHTSLHPTPCFSSTSSSSPPLPPLSCSSSPFAPPPSDCGEGGGLACVVSPFVLSCGHL